MTFTKHSQYLFQLAVDLHTHLIRTMRTSVVVLAGGLTHVFLRVWSWFTAAVWIMEVDCDSKLCPGLKRAKWSTELRDSVQEQICINVCSSNIQSRATSRANHRCVPDDGKLFHGSGVGVPFGPRCFEGDIMGCGIMFPRDFCQDSTGERCVGSFCVVRVVLYGVPLTICPRSPFPSWFLCQMRRMTGTLTRVPNPTRFRTTCTSEMKRRRRERRPKLRIWTAGKSW